MHSVAVIVGSLRRESLNRRFAEAVARLGAGHLDFRFVEIGDLPLYDEDLWQEPPPGVLRMKREVEAASAVLFVTPEYNRYFTPAIKNAIDWGTRPWGKNSWDAKPAAIIGTSPGAIGTAAAQSALKGLVVVCGMVLMGQPEVYFTWKADAFDAEGNVADPGVRGFLETFVDRFAAWIARATAAHGQPSS
jgi:chromate reductase